MHLSRILDQIKRHPSPTEALTKLGKAMDKHEDNLLEKGFRILKSELCANIEDEYEYSDRYAYPERNRMDRDRREEDMKRDRDSRNTSVRYF